MSRSNTSLLVVGGPGRPTSVPDVKLGCVAQGAGRVVTVVGLAGSASVATRPKS